MLHQIFQTYQMLFLKQVELRNIRQLLYTAIMKCKVQRFVSTYWIVYVTFMQVLAVVVALMNQKCTEENDRAYITQMDSYICVQIYAVMLLHSSSTKF